jgi:WD40 repeat protein
MEGKILCDCCIENKEIMKFTCSHKICPSCLPHVFLFNQETILEHLNRSKQINLTCPVCKEGEFKINKSDLLQEITKNVKNKEKINNCEKHKTQFEFYCKKCESKLCLICFNEHKYIYPAHTIVNNIDDIGKICKVHYDDNKRYKYQCLTCNETICSMCKDESHNDHKVKSVKNYNAEKLEVIKKEFPYRDIGEISNKALGIFAPIRTRLKDKQKTFVTHCSELIDSITNIMTKYNDRYKQVEEDLDIAQELVRLSLTNYYKGMEELKNFNPFNIKFDKEYYIMNEDYSQYSEIMDFFNKTKTELKKYEEKISEYINNLGVGLVKINFKCNNILEGHTGVVWPLLQLSDGRLVSGSCDNTIRIWENKTTYKNTNVLKGHTNFVKVLIELKDGKLASGSGDGTIRVWNLKEFKCENIIEGHTCAIYSLVYLPSSKLISISNDKSIRIWDTRNNYKCLQVIEENSSFVFTLVNLGGNKIATGSGDSLIKIWEYNNKENTLKCVNNLEGHTDLVTCIIQLKDSRLASGSRDKTIRLWDYNTCKCITVLKQYNAVYSLIQLRDGRLASGIDNTIRLWDPKENFKCTNIIEGHTGSVNTLIQLKDGSLVTGSSDNTIRIWN